MKKIYDTLKNLSIINLGLLATVVIMMLVLVFTQTFYYELISAWHGSVVMVIVQIVIDATCAILERKMESRKERA